MVIIKIFFYIIRTRIEESVIILITILFPVTIHNLSVPSRSLDT